jgi:hypothetical protein
VLLAERNLATLTAGERAWLKVMKRADLTKLIVRDEISVEMNGSPTKGTPADRRLEREQKEPSEGE